MPNDLVLEAVRGQIQSCSKIGSPFYAGLLEAALAEPRAELPFWNVMDAWTGNPLTALLPLRLLGAVHDLVLAERAGELALHFPRPQQPGDATAAWPLINELIARERAFVAARLNDELQTNEVRRCAVLLPGFLEIHRRSGGLPMHLAELGASGGLNLCWDRYRYALGDTTWGDPNAALLLETQWRGKAPPAGASLEVLSRRGCDISPLDLRVEANRRRLMSFVWPDQFERLELLRRALDVATHQSMEIVEQSAGDFVDDVLERETPDAVKVIYHSIMWLYVPHEEREHIRQAIAAAASSATAQSPLAWLRMEFDDAEHAGLWLDYWPGAGVERERLARCHYHGTSVEWIGAAR